MTTTVYIVDDDNDVRDSLVMLCETHGFTPHHFSSAHDFLQSCPLHSDGCLILDLKMPNMTGVQLQNRLGEIGIKLPIIFLTAHGDIPTTAQAMKLGAIDFLTKPVDGNLLIDRIKDALIISEQWRKKAASRQSIITNLAQLTKREHEVLMLAATGKSNKAIARILNISHRTVEIHRAHAMKKTGTTNVLELAQIVDLAGLLSQT